VRYFRLHGSQHNENGVNYTRGQLVPSEFDLAKIFSVKFVEVDQDAEDWPPEETQDLLDPKTQEVPGKGNLTARYSIGRALGGQW
jgi:hypothetical protein